MKSSTKRLLSLLIVLAMALSLMPMVAFAADTILYVQPNKNWNIDNARFAAYFFGNGETWLDCTDADGDGVYEVVAPAGFTHVIFCRMNPKAAANNWNNKWNQTADLPIPTDSKTCYVVAENTWDKGKGQWVEYVPGGAIETEPTTKSPIEYSVAGVAALCGSAWTPDDINNMMTDKDADGIYTITYVNVAEGSYAFKVTDGTWSNSWGGNGADGNYEFTMESAADVTINFNSADKTIEVISEGLKEVEPTEPSTTPVEPIIPGTQTYSLVGYINGADYGCEGDFENIGEYIFVDGTLTVSFTADSYIFVKTTDNTKCYMPAAYTTDTSATFVVNGGEKMFVPGNAELIFTLVENCEEGTVTVSYEIGQQLPTDPSDPSDPSEPVAATYYVAGDFNGWNCKDEAYMMTGDGIYTLDISVTAGAHELKVTNGTWDASWGAATASGNYEFTAATDGIVTVTFDGASVTVTGDCLGEKESMVITTMHVAGDEALTGCNWDPTANVMDVDNGVYSITFTGVATGIYQFKFVANGSWALNWASGIEMPSGENQVAWFNAMGNSSIAVAEDDSTVTLTIDTTNMDMISGEGAVTCAVIEGGAAPIPTTTVSGSVTSSTAGDTTVELISGEDVVATATVSGKTGTYTLENVAAGTYTLKVSKATHVTREYTVTVEAEAVTQDVKIFQIGDVDGNGKLIMSDISKLLSHIRGSAPITDEYLLECANVNGGKLNMGDISTLYAHIKGSKKLF